MIFFPLLCFTIIFLGTNADLKGQRCSIFFKNTDDLNIKGHLCESVTLTGNLFFKTSSKEVQQGVGWCDLISEECLPADQKDINVLEKFKNVLSKTCGANDIEKIDTILATLKLIKNNCNKKIDRKESLIGHCSIKFRVSTTIGNANAYDYCPAGSLHDGTECTLTLRQCCTYAAEFFENQKNKCGQTSNEDYSLFYISQVFIRNAKIFGFYV